MPGSIQAFRLQSPQDGFDLVEYLVVVKTNHPNTRLSEDFVAFGIVSFLPFVKLVHRFPRRRWRRGNRNRQ